MSHGYLSVILTEFKFPLEHHTVTQNEMGGNKHKMYEFCVNL